MIIIFKTNNCFLKAQLRVCNINYLEIEDFEDILNLKDEIKTDYFYILSKNFGLMEKFYDDLKK